MAENEISDYFEVDIDNVDITGVTVQENVMKPSNVNNAFRALQGALKRWFKTSLFRLRDSTDQTKLLAFDLSGLTTATTRTLTVQDKSGTLALTSDLISYNTTATAAGTTTLTAASAELQYFTGTTTQTVVLPVTSTLALGKQFRIVNNSTGLVTVQSSGANTIQVMGGTGITFAPGAPGTELVVTCIAITGTGTASWAFEYLPPTTGWVIYTPTFTGFGTPPSNRFYSRRVGSNLEVRGKFVVGTSTATEARITMGFNGANNNVTSDGNLVNSIQPVGVANIATVAAASYYALMEATVGYFTFGVQSAANAALTKQNGSNLIGSGDTLAFSASIPITNW